MRYPRGGIERRQQSVANIFGHVEQLRVVPLHSAVLLLEHLGENVRREKATDDADIGLKDGDDNVAVE